VNVWCSEHGRSMGIVRLHKGAWPEFVTRSPRWRDRNAAELGHPEERDNSWTNLREWTRPEVEAKGCRECGPRMLPVADLLAAFEGGRSKIAL
jgi:hypothetical protein